MRKRFFLAATFAASLFVLQPHVAFAQDPNLKSEEHLDEPLNGDLVNSELGSEPDEAPPPAEYPYPGAKEEGVVAPRVTESQQEPPAEVERPAKVDAETGDYFYDANTAEKAQPVSRSANRMPEKVLDNGEYQFKDPEPEPYHPVAGHEAAESVLKNGDYKYPIEHSPLAGAASFRVGYFGPPKLVNPDTTKTFQDIYTKDQLPVVFAEYEMPLTKTFGVLGLKFGSGIFVAQGQGQFVKTDAGRRPDDLPPEKYTFLMLPNEVTVQYRFQYSDKQPIIPYVEGGMGLYTFAELRDDSQGPRFGGALTTVFAGGANLMLDWLDPDAIERLDADYGINHVYLTAELRQIVGLNKTYDFTSSVINAGFLLQF